MKSFVSSSPALKQVSVEVTHNVDIVVRSYLLEEDLMFFHKLVDINFIPIDFDEVVRVIVEFYHNERRFNDFLH